MYNAASSLLCIYFFIFSSLCLKAIFFFSLLHSTQKNSHLIFKPVSFLNIFLLDTGVLLLSSLLTSLFLDVCTV
jgi:hypothetical protein